MNKNIEHYVFHKENFLEESYCENSINELSMCDWKKHFWYEPQADQFNSRSGDNEPEVFEYHMFSNNIGKFNQIPFAFCYAEFRSASPQCTRVLTPLFPNNPHSTPPHTHLIL